MQSRHQRHLTLPGTAPAGIAKRAKKPEKPAELSWHDYLVLLLHIGAEIEHALMVEYLYAAYSLGGDQVPAEHRRMVWRWQVEILTVAREEMGHLLTVQNLLTLLGAPLCLDREDYPWDSPYYPFEFRLEPLTLGALACYVYAEMPPDPTSLVPKSERAQVKREAEDIRAEIRRHYPGETPHHVGEIYDQILDILGNPELIPDSLFRGETYAHQATFDDWGRNYKAAPKALDAEGSLLDRQPTQHVPHVIVEPMASRTEAIQVLTAVAGQGEAPHVKTNRKDEESHFVRFLRIWREYRKAVKGWKPARDVPVNPTTLETARHGKPNSYIANPRSRRWAALFNARYRMLLTYLAHALRLQRRTSPLDPSVRAPVMHRVFAEMYNLKSIAGMLTQMPFAANAGGKGSGRRGRKRRAGEPQFAGPPFEMPYTLDLPDRESDAWRMHRELLHAAMHLERELLADAPAAGERYLRIALDVDAQSEAWLQQIIHGPLASEPAK